MTKPETVADVLAEMKQQTRDGWTSDARLCRFADRIERAMAASAVPVARVAEVHMSRYTIEWVNGPLPEGSLLYGSAPTVCWQHRPGSPCPWPASCRSNGCSAVERELFPDAHAPPAVPVESLGRDAPDPVPLNAVRAALEAVDTGRTQIARDNLRILEIHLRAQSAPPPASVPDGSVLMPRNPPNGMLSAMADTLEDPNNERSSWDLAANMYAAAIAYLTPTNQEGAANAYREAKAKLHQFHPVVRENNA